METAWKKIQMNEYDKVWERFFEKLKFKPSIHKTDWPGIDEPVPSMTFDISHIYNNKDYDKLNGNLQSCFLSYFQNLIEKEDWIYVLDWQHDCYEFYPHKTTGTNWPIEILPNGDYYIFLEKDFDFGIFGHPWEQTICVFGDKLLSLIETQKPTLFDKIVRSKR